MAFFKNLSTILWWIKLCVLAASAFNRLHECANSPGNRAYCFAELAVSSLAVTVTIASTHYNQWRRYTRARQAKWPGWRASALAGALASALADYNFHKFTTDVQWRGVSDPSGDTGLVLRPFAWAFAANDLTDLEMKWPWLPWRPGVATAHYAYPRTDGQAELAWVAWLNAKKVFPMQLARDYGPSSATVRSRTLARCLEPASSNKPQCSNRSSF